MEYNHLYKQNKHYIKSKKFCHYVSQFEAAASLLYRSLITPKHAAKVDELFYPMIDKTSGKIHYTTIGSKSIGIKGFMNYTQLKKFFTRQGMTKEAAATHIFNLLENAGFGKVYAALRFGQDDDLTIKNLTVSTHKENKNLIINSVIILDVDRSLGATMYGTENNKYGISQRNIPGWDATMQGFAVTAIELDNPYFEQPNQGMFYSPAQNPSIECPSLAWKTEDKIAFKNMAKNRDGKFYSDFCHTLFKAAYILEPIIKPILLLTIRHQNLLSTIENSLLFSTKSIQSAILQSTNFKKIFLQNYFNWLEQTKKEITSTKEFLYPWNIAKLRDELIPENALEFVENQFAAMHKKISENIPLV